MKNPTKKSTVEELLAFIKSNEEMAGEACMASEGTQGCEEASEMLHLHAEIEKLIS